MQQGPTGFENYATQDVLVLISIVLLVVGLLLAFAGRTVWKHVMSFIGAIIGGLLGFTFGTAIGGWLVGFIVGMLGAMVGSAMFVFLSELALALVAGLLAYILGDAVTGSQIVGLVAAAVAFGLTVVFIKEAIGVVTAIVGGLLVGIALVWSEFVDMTMAVIAMFAVMVFGAAVQLMGVREEERRMREHPAAQAAAVAASVPSTPPIPGRSCPKCSGPLTYIPEYNRFYCYKCQRYD